MASVERCTIHGFEVADRLCGDCGRPFCSLCLVNPFPRRPPLCHQCAVAAAGIRKGARPTPVRSKREIKAFERERRMADERPAPSAPSEGAFGPAKPAISAGPSRTTSRPDATKRPAPDQEDEETKKRTDDETTGSGSRNRPLWGLAR